MKKQFFFTFTLIFSLFSPVCAKVIALESLTKNGLPPVHLLYDFHQLPKKHEKPATLIQNNADIITCLSAKAATCHSFMERTPGQATNEMQKALFGEPALERSMLIKYLPYVFNKMLPAERVHNVDWREPLRQLGHYIRGAYWRSCLSISTAKAPCPQATTLADIRTTMSKLKPAAIKELVCIDPDFLYPQLAKTLGTSMTADVYAHIDKLEAQALITEQKEIAQARFKNALFVLLQLEYYYNPYIDAKNAVLMQACNEKGNEIIAHFGASHCINLRKVLIKKGYTVTKTSLCSGMTSMPKAFDNAKEQEKNFAYLGIDKTIISQHLMA